MSVPPRIGTERLVLRAWRAEDAGAVYRRGSDAAFGRYILAIPWPYDRADAEAFVGMVLERQERPNEWWWTITVRPGDESAGDLNAIMAPATGVVSMGWGIAPEHWGKGLMTEAVRAVIDWLFASTKAFKAVATADAENVGSWRVMEKAGMRREGLIRGERMHRGERRDEVRYGLLRTEWELARS